MCFLNPCSLRGTCVASNWAAVNNMGLCHDFSLMFHIALWKKKKNSFSLMFPKTCLQIFKADVTSLMTGAIQKLKFPLRSISLFKFSVMALSD